MKKVSNKKAVNEIATFEKFSNHTGSFTGHIGRRYSFGRLPSKFVDAYELTPIIEYTIMSYGTPIAWKTQTGWKMPKVKYSSTTSRHQSITQDVIKNTDNFQILE